MITIDYKDRTPIYEQIYQNVQKLVALGVFKQDEKLPSVRALAVELATNPNTVQKAYTLLESKGIIYTVKGIGNFISKNDIDVKSTKLRAIYNEIETKVVESIEYGLDIYIFDQWEKKLRGIINDSSKKSQ